MKTQSEGSEFNIKIFVNKYEYESEKDKKILYGFYF